MSVKWDMVILGCGQLGGNLKRHLESFDYHVLGVRRTPASDDQTMLALDLDNPKTWQDLSKVDINQKGVLVGIVTPDEFSEEGYSKRYVGLARAISSFLKVRDYSVVWVSSTAVFGKEQFGDLSEKTEPRPQNWRGKCLLEAEALIQKSTERSSILRYAGLYTAPGVQKLYSKKFRERIDPSAVSNRLHREDAMLWLAALVKRFRHGEAVPCIVHGVDLCPAHYGDIFRYLDGEINNIRCANSGRRIISVFRDEMPELKHPSLARLS